MINTKTAFVALIGRPNVGKSSLLNALVGRKVAIVTPKSQTTRTRIMGVVTRGVTQFVFLDTPGFLRVKTRLDDYMSSQIAESISGVDLNVFVVEAFGGKIRASELALFEKVKTTKAKRIFVLSKFDKVKDKREIIHRMGLLKDQFAAETIIPVSSVTGYGVDSLLQELEGSAQESQHFFPEDMFTDKSEKFVVAEIVREKMLLNLNEEVPHTVAVITEQLKRRGDLLNIDVCILCERKNHKGIIIGKGGETLKRIATQSRRDMEAFFSLQVNLKCWVKVKEDWRNQSGFVERLCES
jgi:GTP-binding protein Era